MSPPASSRDCPVLVHPPGPSGSSGEEELPLSSASENVPCKQDADSTARSRLSVTRVNLFHWCKELEPRWKPMLTGLCVGVFITVLAGVTALLATRYSIPDNVIKSGRPYPRGCVPYNGTGYCYSAERRNWTSSKAACEEKGAILAVLWDKQVNKLVTRFTEHRDEQWCGGYMEDGRQKWLDETSARDERLNNISGTNCMTWTPDGLLERDCSMEYYYICIISLQQQQHGALDVA